MKDWSKKEVEIIVRDYFAMLSYELRGITYNKSAHRLYIKPLLDGRSDSSIEFKHQNISAILIELGLPYIKGYKPRGNSQKLLQVFILGYLENHYRELQPLFESFADAPILAKPDLTYEDVTEEPPKFVNEPELTYQSNPLKINFLEREQQNKELGNRGELFALEYEKKYLRQIGKDLLADQVELIAGNDDSAGFDILSRNSNGTDKYIEVKTTKLTKEAPFFFSINEYSFSLRHNRDYFLYRVFNFNDKPKLFRLNGSFDDFCYKEPVKFKGRIR